MKTCPFCREDIRDDAIKCRYCGSSLLAAQPGADVPAQPQGDGSTVIYVVDKGLVTFAKFVGGALAVFITVGAALYGYNINDSRDKVSQTAEKVGDLRDKINDKIHDAEEKIRASQATIETQVKHVQDTAKQVDSDAAAAKKDRDAIAADSQAIAADRRRIAELLEQVQRDAQRAHSLTAGLAGQAAGAAGDNGEPIVATGSYTPRQIAELYEFPLEFSGKGQTIGVISLGGGYQASDLATFFSELKLAPPEVVSVSVDGAQNKPGGNAAADNQLTQDIEIAGAIAPGARIVVYFAPNTSLGFVEALRRAINDDARHPSVVVVAWGSPEASWTKVVMATMNAALTSAMRLGVTVIVATGDSGVTDGLDDGKAHVDFPASSPYVLAVGGTRLVASGKTITEEVVWNDGRFATGGGVSEFFPPPPWQKQVKLPGPGRGIPDVAAHADPALGYRVVVGGKSFVAGGTGASAALWAGLIALINEGVGRNVGYINPVLYEQAAAAGTFRSITSGDNGVNGVKGYPAGPGWNASAGWGSPNGKKLLSVLRESRADKRP